MLKGGHLLIVHWESREKTETERERDRRWWFGEGGWGGGGHFWQNTVDRESEREGVMGENETTTAKRKSWAPVQSLCCRARPFISFTGISVPFPLHGRVIAKRTVKLNGLIRREPWHFSKGHTHQKKRNLTRLTLGLFELEFDLSSQRIFIYCVLCWGDVTDLLRQGEEKKPH